MFIKIHIDIKKELPFWFLCDLFTRVSKCLFGSNLVSVSLEVETDEE